MNELIERGVAAHRAGNVEEAIKAYRAALDQSPQDAEAKSLYGLALAHSGRTAEAEPILLEAIKLAPKEPGFHVNLAECYEKAGQYDRAVKALEAAVKIDALRPNAWDKLGDVFVHRQNLVKAVEAYSTALALAPGTFPFAIKLARAQAALGRHDEAWQSLAEAAKIMPGHDGVFGLQTEILRAQRDWPALELVAGSWARAHPRNPAAWRAVSTAAFELGQHRYAAEAYTRVLQLGERNAQTLATLGGLLMHALEYESAQSALDESEKLDANLPDMLASKGLLLTYLGRFAEAEQYCRRALARDPELVHVFTNLSRLTRGKFNDDELKLLAHIAGRADKRYEQRIPAAFAYAHALDARGDAAAAFAAYQQANAIALERGAREGLRYDPGEAARRVDAIQALVPAAPQQFVESQGPRPIFIVGMPRSGTTLIESVLSAHSRVNACGERPMMQQILRAALTRADGGELGQPPAELLEQWVAAYRFEVPEHPGIDHVTDKNPLNFEAIGLIVQLFPQARIVHVRRNPLETGLSIYRQEFNKFWTFANRLEDIGHFHGCYARLMRHWERILGNRLVTIQYERFVGDFQGNAKALVEACGLAWEPACASFQQAPRAIATFSTVQARDPVASQNVRAQRYRAHLDPLITALNAANVDLESGALRG